MFKRLEQKWNAGPLQIVLIIICFALGGSVTGYAGKKIIDLFAIRQDWLWAIIYIFLVALIWPLAVIVVSVFFGQFKFFRGYVGRLGAKFGIARSSEFEVPGQRPAVRIARIAIFASGAGTNTKRIIDHFRNSYVAKIALIVCNNKGAGVLKIAEEEKIPSLIIAREKFFKGNAYFDEIAEKKIDFIVLAGFLWKIPGILLRAYPKRIINIHPALLPKYGGKGMFGSHVHEAVLAQNEQESGITIHFVDEHYDNGDIILQVRCPVLTGDTPESLANRVHVLEHANYPVVIEDLVKDLVKQAT